MMSAVHGMPVEIEPDRQQIRERAVAAREQAIVARERAWGTTQAALDRATHAIDASIGVGSVMGARAERLSNRVGRSPVIEQAKARLAAEYGISRGDAFELLVALSNRSNRKLRDVAERLVRAA